jgi:hypothetical protein
MSLDPTLRRKLRDFGRALSAAISDSGEASKRLEELREEGYSLYLLLDGSGRDGSDAAAPRGSEPLAAAGSRGGALQRTPRQLPARASREPSFRINGEDVAFLRSVGIDPTRPVRRRRTLDDRS